MSSTAVSVSVAADAATAFHAFTEELDQWWVRGPINYYDYARAVGMRCEPGVGGRLVEVYDEETGEGLELGRITAWEPGTRLAWNSSLDDVTIDVQFSATAAGTDVTVTATLPERGADRGGTAWVRVVPKWFGPWCARRGSAPPPQPELGRLAVGVYYAKPAAAARWLASAFGFGSPDPLPAAEHEHQWIEFRAGNCSVMLFQREDEPLPEDLPPEHEVWVYVDDLDAHFASAQAAGAKIVRGIHQSGFRAYSAEDPEGRRWTFAQARPGQA
jgi:uncharacterized glyoxalase superfamily protein PhnB